MLHTVQRVLNRIGYIQRRVAIHVHDRQAPTPKQKGSHMNTHTSVTVVKISDSFMQASEVLSHWMRSFSVERWTSTLGNCNRVVELESAEASPARSSGSRGQTNRLRLSRLTLISGE